MRRARGVGMFAAVLGLLGLVMLGLAFYERPPAAVDYCPGCGVVASSPAPSDTPQPFGEAP